MPKIKIGDRFVGDGYPCYIIAEAGVNYNGDIELAKKLVKAAKDADADAVKFQIWITEEVMVKNLEKPDYQKAVGDDGETQFDMVKKLELTFDETKEIAAYAKKIDIVYLSTAEGKRCTDLLEEIGVAAYKIGSADMDNYPHLKYVAKKGKPIILSTGMATMEEVKNSVDFIKKSGNDQIILLHCTTSYPAKLSEVNLNAMITMKELGLPVGYSDHTEGIIVPQVAVSVGACLVEKHFTLDKNLPGPDHKASLEPNELKEMINKISNLKRINFKVDDKILEEIMGSEEKRPTKSEREIERFVRKYVVANADIKENNIITEEMLAVKRTGGRGISPSHFYEIIGRKAKQNIKRDEVVEWKMVE
jgi:N-acetylneuraminate synthase/N,N'-diacetyllegionaminate synthase